MQDILFGVRRRCIGLYEGGWCVLGDVLFEAVSATFPRNRGQEGERKRLADAAAAAEAGRKRAEAVVQVRGCVWFWESCRARAT